MCPRANVIEVLLLRLQRIQMLSVRRRECFVEGVGLAEVTEHSSDR